MKITIDEKAIQEKRNLLRKERRHKIKESLMNFFAQTGNERVVVRGGNAFIYAT